MRILAVETSCDETSASVIEKQQNRVIILSNITSSSIKLHAETGGIIPEKAAREQVRFIIPVIIEALFQSGPNHSSSEIEKLPLNNEKKYTFANKILKEKIDAIAVTVGPGLIGSLLVGVETSKTLSYVFNKPIIPVNHLLGHIYANFIEISNINDQISHIKFPFIGLIVSGGHTDLLLFKSHKNFKWLGGTRDDAAGEAFDKIARIIGIPYPGGPSIEKAAKNGDPKAFNFPSPMIDSEDFDFSFSGLKTAVQRKISTMKQLNNETINNTCLAVQNAIVKVLVKKTILAAEKFKTSTIVIGGGVSANEALREQMKKEAEKQLKDTKIFFPELKYTTDNAAMIGAYALLAGKPKSWKSIKAQPELYFD